MPTKVRPKVPPSSPPPVPPTSPPPIVGVPILGSFGNASIDKWNTAFVNAVDAVKRKKGVSVDPLVMKAIMDVETGGDGTYPASRCRAKDSFDDVPACGPMQIKYQYHKLRCPECDFTTVPGQIELATHIIGDTMKARGGDEYDALTASYFPADDPGHSTQNQYVAKVRSLVATMSGTTPAPKPPPKPKITEQDILNLIGSNAPGIYVSFGFNQLNTDGGQFYRYGKGHGTTGNDMHSGIDIWMPDETPVNAVFGGEVLCVGTQGRVMWGQGCGSFVDDAHGVGNVTILTDEYATIGGKRYQLKMTYGHMSSSPLKVGDRVQDGQRIGRSGVGNGWPHVHLDVSINAPELNNPQIWNNPGEYHLMDPLPTILNAMGGAELPVVYAERLPLPQPQEFDVSAKVVATRDGVKVLQRADMNAAEVRKPLAKGEDFDAVYQVIGEDRRIYWVTLLGSRISVDGTESDEWPA